MQAQLNRVNEIAQQNRDKYIIVLMSLGQLNKYDWKRTVGAFSTILATQSVFPAIIAKPFYWLYVAARYFLDEKVFGGKIAEYKKGDIDTDQFVTWMRSIAGFGALTDVQIKDSWNAMSEIKTESAEALSTLLQNNPNVHLAIFSATNPLHYEYTKTQLQETGVDLSDLALRPQRNYNAPNVSSCVLSHSYGHPGIRSLDPKTLASTAFAYLVNAQGTVFTPHATPYHQMAVVSLHHAIQTPQDVGNWPDPFGSFEYVPSR